MYPYSSNNNGTSIFGNYYNDTNNSSTTPPSSSFLLPSPINYIPLEDEAVYSDFLQQQQHFLSNHHSTINPAHEMSNNVESTMGECSYKKLDGDDDDDHLDFITLMEPENSSTPRKIIKKDRHSKINTARGPRDRRMRLSLDVAKKLFGLQDLLGFDKASKTVDWLLTKSRTAILDLLPDQSCSFMGVSNNSTSSTSECEVLSGTGDQFMKKAGDDDQETTKNKVAKSCSGSSSKKQKEKTSKVRKCVDFHHPLAKETRQKARERARERTIIKRNNKHVGGGQDSNFRPFLNQSMDQDVNRLGSWRPFEESQRQFIDQMGSNIRFNQGFVDDNSSLLMTNNWNPYLFSYQHSSGLTHEHELNDCQHITGNSWEGNNN